MARAFNGQAVTATPARIFATARPGVGGSDPDGVTAFTLYNEDAAEVLLVRVLGHHYDLDPGTADDQSGAASSTWFPIPPQKSATFGLRDGAGHEAQLDAVWVKRGGSTNLTCGGGVVERR